MQVEIVTEILGALHKERPESIVKQMIMGAGKTCVVSPLLGLMLADNKSLLLQVSKLW
jgi:hypothetical protein